jgi:hypothetical protein
MGAVGDMLILGRPCAGAAFDQAIGAVPPHVVADNRWRSLWNGAALSTGRIHAGTVIGLVGVGLVEWLAMRTIGGNLPAGHSRKVAVASATAFALSGAVTHLSCGTVILAYRQASNAVPEFPVARQPSPQSVTGLLGVSAVGSLIALAAFSTSLTVELLRRGSTASTWRLVITPFPCVLATLLTFGQLPTPVGGYARPASINIGLIAYFAASASFSERGAPRP